MRIASAPKDPICNQYFHKYILQFAPVPRPPDFSLKRKFGVRFSLGAPNHAIVLFK